MTQTQQIVADSIVAAIAEYGDAIRRTDKSRGPARNLYPSPDALAAEKSAVARLVGLAATYGLTPTVGDLRGRAINAPKMAFASRKIGLLVIDPQGSYRGATFTAAAAAAKLIRSAGFNAATLDTDSPCAS
jgi:hypothetical protein